MDLFSIKQDRISRKSYWMTMLILCVVTCGVFAPQVLLYEKMSDALFYILFVIDFFYFVISMILIVIMVRRRLNDAGVSPPDRFTLWVALIPFVLWFSYRLDLDIIGYAYAIISFLIIQVLCLKGSIKKEV